MQRILEEVLQSGYERRYDSLAKQLPREWVEQALSATGTATLRRRRLPAEHVLWLVIGMAMLRGRSIVEVLSKLDLALPAKGEVAKSSLSEARHRVGSEALQWLCKKTGSQWAEQARCSTFHGLSVMAMDGVLFHTADSAANSKHFGKASGGGYAESGYPIVRGVTLSCMRSHLIVSAAVGGYRDAEQVLLRETLSEVPENSVTLLDKNFHAVPFLWDFAQSGPGRHWLLAAKKNIVVEVEKRLAKNDFIATLRPSAGSRKKYPELPETLRCRARSFRHSKTGKQRLLLTSLLDAQTYPRKELVALYRERWEIELSYNEIKTHMLEAKTTLRSKTPQGVIQELWGTFIAYNLIRFWMLRIARKKRCSPLRVSFTASLHYIQDEWMWCALAAPGTLPKKLRDLEEKLALYMLPKRRKKRSYPRIIKFRATKYPKKHNPKISANNLNTSP